MLTLPTRAPDAGRVARTAVPTATHSRSDNRCTSSRDAREAAVTTLTVV